MTFTTMKKFNFLLLFALMAFASASLLSSCGDDDSTPPPPDPDPEPDTTKFTDPRDNQTYDLVYINGTTWFAENLNINTNTTDTTSYYCYDDNPANCDTLGGLYTFYAAKVACPAGFHLSTEAEWEALITAAGGAANEPGKALKEGGSLGFNALLTGSRLVNPSGGSAFLGKGDNANFWVIDETEDSFSSQVRESSNSVSLRKDSFTKNAFCVRCVKD